LLFEILAHDPRYVIKMICLDGINALVNEKSVIPIEFERRERDSDSAPSELLHKKRKRDGEEQDGEKETDEDLKKKKLGENVRVKQELNENAQTTYSDYDGVAPQACCLLVFLCLLMR
jgi:hypothetical protein